MSFVADLVGDLGSPSIARIPDLDSDSLVHFAIYDCRRLVKIVLLNLDYFDETSTRAAKNISLGSTLG